MAIVLHHEEVDDRNWEETKQITHNKRSLPGRNAKILASQKPVYMSQGLSKKTIVCALKSLYQYCTHRPDGKFSHESIMSYLICRKVHDRGTTTSTWYCYSSYVANRIHVVVNYLRDKMVEEWRPEDMRQYVHPGVLGYNILHCQLIFAPTLFEDKVMLCVGLGGEEVVCVRLPSPVNSFAKKCLDELTKSKMEILLLSLDGTLRKEDVKLEIGYVEVPEQPNLYDCGVYVLKFMELWEPKKEMPYFKYEQILKFRQDYICDWVRHPENEVRETVLKGAKLWGKLR
ncbi:Ulp1 protease family, C-terminal catalytic domain [Sesbania bispinosa]|nr:Ulp1 protease family, C-terminal catalytic domain [Sesbania bispinosa]